MGDFFAGFLVGTIFSAVLTYGIVTHELISECQKNLPRSQLCVMIAVPEEPTTTGEGGE